MNTDVVLTGGKSSSRFSRSLHRLKDTLWRLPNDIVGYWPWRALIFFLRIIYGFRVEGMANLPKDGPYILVLNEWSLLATLISGWISVLQIVRLHSLKPNAMLSYVQEELWRIGVFRRMTKNPKSRGHYAPLEPHGAGRLALALMDGYRMLREGGIVIINPEGDMPWDGRPKPIAQGVCWMALHSGAPVVVALVSPSAYDIWPRWQTGPSLRGKLKLTIRPPFTLSDAPKARVTDADMVAAAERLAAVFHEIRYGAEGMAAWTGPVLRNGEPVDEAPALPLIKLAPPVAAEAQPPTPVAKRGLVQLLWRCPICHGEDVLVHLRPRFRAQSVHCRACDTVWAVKRCVGRDFRLCVVSGPQEVLGLEMALSAWYDAMKKDFKPEARDLRGVDLLPGEEAYLAVEGVQLLPHCPSHLLDGWTEIEPPTMQPRGTPLLGEWESIGAGRLVLTNQRLHWQGSDRQVDFYWGKVAAVSLWGLNSLGIRYGSAPYRLPLGSELGIKWLTYAGTLAQQVTERNGASVTVSPF